MKCKFALGAALSLALGSAVAAPSHLGAVIAENMFDLTIENTLPGSHQLLRDFGQVTMDVNKANACFQVTKAMVITDVTIASITQNPQSTQAYGLHLYGNQGASFFTIAGMRPTVETGDDERTTNFEGGLVMPTGSSFCMNTVAAGDRYNWISARVKGYYMAK